MEIRKKSVGKDWKEVPMNGKVKKDFLWGTASAAYQCEGAGTRYFKEGERAENSKKRRK